MVTHDAVMDIHDSVIDIHKLSRTVVMNNSIMDVHNSVIGIHNPSMDISMIKWFIYWPLVFHVAGTCARLR